MSGELSVFNWAQPGIPFVRMCVCMWEWGLEFPVAICGSCGDHLCVMRECGYVDLKDEFAR